MLVVDERAQQLVGLQRALGLGGDVMSVLVEVGVDPVDGFVLGIVVSLALFGREICGHNLAATIEGSRNDVRAFFETQTDEGFHHRYCTSAVLEGLPALLRQSARFDFDVIAADGAFEHLAGGVMRAGPFLSNDRNVEHVARCLQPVVKGQDGLRRDRGSQCRDFAVAFAALQPIDAGPFANVVAVR